MSWDIFFSHLETPNAVYLAELAVSRYWPWILLFTSVFNLVSTALIIKRGVINDEKRLQRLCVQGALVSWISWTILIILYFWLRNPQGLLRQIDTSINSFWQLSPLGITKILNYLTLIGVVGIGLIGVIVFWFIYTGWHLFIKSVVGNLLSTTSYIETESKEIDETNMITRNNQSFGLLFLADEEGEIESVRFEHGSVHELGEMVPWPINTNRLFFRIIYERRLAIVYEEEPQVYDVELRLMKEGQFGWRGKSEIANLEGQPFHLISPGLSFFVKSCKIKICSIAEKELNNKKMHFHPTSIAISVGFFLLLASMVILPVSVSGYQRMLGEEHKECFDTKDAEPLRLIFGGDDSWLIQGQLSVSDSLTNTTQNSEYEQLIKIKYDKNRMNAHNEYDDEIKIKKTDWHLKTNVFYLKLLFDLDTSYIYNSNSNNPLSSSMDDAESNEIEFWEKLIVSTLKPFHQALARGDIDEIYVSVFSMAACTENYPPGAQVFSDPNAKNMEMTLAGAVAPISKLIECGYNSPIDNEWKDVTEAVWNAPIKKKNGADNRNQGLIIIRWRPESLRENKYERLTPDPDIPSNRIIVIDIDRYHKSVPNSKIMGYPVIHIQAPNRGNRSGSISKEVTNGIKKIIKERASHVVFSAKLKKLVDSETWKSPVANVELVKFVKNDREELTTICSSNDIPVQSSEYELDNAPVILRIVIFGVIIITLIFSVWTLFIMILLLGGFINDHLGDEKGVGTTS